MEIENNLAQPPQQQGDDKQQHRKKTFVLVDELNLDKPPRFRLLKQNQLSIFLKGFLESFGKVENISFNQNVNGFYPDVVFLYQKMNFIIEIDEFQHKRGLLYAKEREDARLQSLRKAFNPLTMIRINPDKCHERRMPMIMMVETTSKEKEIIVNAGEMEYRCEEISKLLRWIFFSLQQNHRIASVPFVQFNLFFDQKRT
jgi:hypothetical protein